MTTLEKGISCDWACHVKVKNPMYGALWLFYIVWNYGIKYFYYLYLLSQIGSQIGRGKLMV